MSWRIDRASTARKSPSASRQPAPRAICRRTRSTNGGYQAAREEQAKNEGRINELTVKLRNATIVEAPKAGKVGNGSLVTLELAGREMTYALGSRDIKVATKYDVISPESPIGAAILGANEGDTVSYKAPNGREISVVIKEAKPLS